MDEGRRWAIETFGSQGVHIRARVAELVREEHAASADAQDASGHRSRGVYGEFWRGILERFEEFGALPHATLLSPGRAPYKIPVVNGVALFPWRYGRSRDEDLAATPFVTSDARAAVFAMDRDITQAEFDLGIQGPGLTDEEREFAEAVEAAMTDSAVTANKVVVVAISSSPMGLHAMRWGDVTVSADGRLEWGFVEDLMVLPAAGPVGLVESGRTFAAGDPPTKDLRLQSEAVDESGVSASDDE